MHGIRAAAFGGEAMPEGLWRSPAIGGVARRPSPRVQAPAAKAVQAPAAAQAPVQSPIQKGAEPYKTARTGGLFNRVR